MLAKFRSFDDNSCYFTVVSSYVGIVRIWTIIFVRVVQVHSTFYDFDVFDTMFSFVWYELSVLRGLEVGGGGGGQILPFPMGFHRRPYNSVAVPCKCVIRLNSRM